MRPSSSPICLLILEPMGIHLEFSSGEGPVLHNPVRTAADVDRLLELETVEPLDFVMETVRKTRAGLPAAPAADRFRRGAVHAGGLRDRGRNQPRLPAGQGHDVHRHGRVGRPDGPACPIVTLYLNAQIDAGVQLVQLFDSWAGCLGTDDYRRYVLPHTGR